MNTTPSRTLCLHANTGDLQFLNKVGNHLLKISPKQSRYLRFGTQHEQADAKLILRKEDGAYVVIMSHGGDGYLLGGEQIRRSTGETLPASQFIDRTDPKCFSGKAFLCMSCNSNSLAQYALDSGAIGFIGFDDIPFTRFSSDGSPISHSVVTQHVQNLMAPAIMALNDHFILKGGTLEHAADYFKLWLDHAALRFVRQMKSVKQRQEITGLLLKMRSGIRYHGRSSIRFHPPTD